MSDSSPAGAEQANTPSILTIPDDNWTFAIGEAGPITQTFVGLLNVQAGGVGEGGAVGMTDREFWICAQKLFGESIFRNTEINTIKLDRRVKHIFKGCPLTITA